MTDIRLHGNPVTSGVPQGSVLGPILFLIHITDIDLDVKNEVLKFVDDTKLFGTVMDEVATAGLQRDLNSLFEWSETWQMEFNVAKCKVMHVGKRNTQYCYEINGTVLQAVNNECDLGIEVRSDIKVSDQYLKAYVRASRVLNMIGRNICYKTPDILLRLYIIISC